MVRGNDSDGNGKKMVIEKLMREERGLVNLKKGRMAMMMEGEREKRGE